MKKAMMRTIYEHKVNKLQREIEKVSSVTKLSISIQ